MVSFRYGDSQVITRTYGKFPDADFGGDEFHFNEEGAVLQGERHLLHGKATSQAESSMAPELSEWPQLAVK